MKKQGFTLAETIITLGIIGIVSAILLTIVSKVKPDETKVAYLKAYDSLAESVQQLTSDTKLYIPVGEYANSITTNQTSFPLMNQDAVKVGSKTYEKESKFCKLVAESMGITDAAACVDTTFESSPYSNDMWKTSSNYFQTQNGMKWIIRQAKATPPGSVDPSDDTKYNIDNIINDVYVKVKESANDCVYDSVNCKTPNVFKFSVGADGKIAPMDARGAYYYDTRRSWIKSEGERDTRNLETAFVLPITNSPKLDCSAKGEDWYIDETGACVKRKPEPEPEPNTNSNTPPEEPQPEPKDYYFTFAVCKMPQSYSYRFQFYLFETNYTNKDTLFILVGSNDNNYNGYPSGLDYIDGNIKDLDINAQYGGGIKSLKKPHYAKPNETRHFNPLERDFHSFALYPDIKQLPSNTNIPGKTIPPGYELSNNYASCSGYNYGKSYWNSPQSPCIGTKTKINNDYYTLNVLKGYYEDDCTKILNIQNMGQLLNL